MTKHIYTTSTGKELQVLPLPPYTAESYRQAFLTQFETEHPEPERPMYHVETAGGGHEDHPHDDSTVETDEERAALEAWQDYQTRRDAHISNRLFDVMIVECVEVDPTKDAKWLARKKFFGVNLPDDENELKLLYVREQMALNDEGGDFNGLSTKITEISGLSEAAVSTGKATFRRSLRRNGRGANRRLAAEADPEQVVDEQPVPGDRDGEGVGVDA